MQKKNIFLCLFGGALALAAVFAFTIQFSDNTRRAAPQLNQGENVGAGCAELCQSSGYESGYCSTYGGGPLPPGETGKPACAEGGDNIGQTNDCNSRAITDAARTCCCQKTVSACKNRGERFSEGQEAAVCCEGLTKLYVYDLAAWQKERDSACENCLVAASPTPSGQMVCANCGDGVCDGDENKFNCASDCATEEDKQNCVLFPAFCGSHQIPGTPPADEK